MAKKVLILDGNKKTAQIIENIILTINNNIQVYVPDGYDEALKLALHTRIDVFVLDIVVNTSISGDTTGLRFAEQIRKMKSYLFVPIIFISGVIDEKFYIFQKLHSFAYIEKPFSSDHVKKVLERALLYETPESEERVLHFRKNGVLFCVNVNNIIFVQAIDHIFHIHMIDEKLEIPYYTIKQFLDDTDNFIQCSRNTVVNRRFIKNVDFTNRYIHMKNTDEAISIGASFTKKISEALLHE